MGSTRVQAMPTLPAGDAVNRPAGVAASSMVWETTLAPGGYAGKQLARGSRLQLQDLEGDGCLSMLIFNAECPVERLNVADTVKVQWNAYLGAGKLLLSDMGRVLMSIIDDAAGTHDTFCGPSTARSNADHYGDGDNWGHHPNARDRFALAAAKFGLSRRDLHPCINWFKGVRIAANGTTEFTGGPFTPGRSLTLRAEMNVIVLLANCPHRLDPRARYAVTPVRASAWRGEPAGGDDALRTATPEGLRAFLNVEDYFCR
jgi:hypothetical protein